MGFVKFFTLEAGLRPDITDDAGHVSHVLSHIIDRLVPILYQIGNLVRLSMLNHLQPVRKLHLLRTLRLDLGNTSRLFVVLLLHGSLVLHLIPVLLQLLVDRRRISGHFLLILRLPLLDDLSVLVLLKTLLEALGQLSKVVG